MTGGELAIIVAGRREDWPGGPRTLTPREPTRSGLVPDRRGGHQPDAGEDARRPRPTPGRRPHRLDQRRPGRSSPASTASRSGSRRPATHGSNVSGGDPPRGGHRPASARSRPPTASWPATSPSSTSRGELRRARRQRWPRRASGPPDRRRTRPGLGGTPSEAAALAAVLATCQRPRAFAAAASSPTRSPSGAAASPSPRDQVVSLSPQMVGLRFHAAARSAGVEPVTAHSGRVGLATELTSRGASTTDVMLAGNWKTSRMVAHYSSGATAERGAVAQYL